MKNILFKYVKWYIIFVLWNILFVAFRVFLSLNILDKNNFLETLKHICLGYRKRAKPKEEGKKENYEIKRKFLTMQTS